MGVSRGEYNCQIAYLAGGENMCVGLFLCIPRQVEWESLTVKLELVMDHKASQININSFYKIEEQPDLEQLGNG